MDKVNELIQAMAEWLLMGSKGWDFVEKVNDDNFQLLLEAVPDYFRFDDAVGIDLDDFIFFVLQEYLWNKGISYEEDEKEKILIVPDDVQLTDDIIRIAHETGFLMTKKEYMREFYGENEE